MHISLVLATIGRTAEFERFLSYLHKQTYCDFDLVIVDQNPDDRLVKILDPYQGLFPIQHHRFSIGVSRARNHGLKYVSGDVIGFPDDDCWYPKNLLCSVVEIFSEHQDLGGLTGSIVESKKKISGNARFDRKAGFVTLRNVWRRANSNSMFFRKKVVDALGGFDEAIGPGAGTPWEGGEDIDYPIRVLKMGFTIYYFPDLEVFHPDSIKGDWIKARGRAYGYGVGMGYVWRKNRFPYWLVAYYVIRPLGGSILNTLIGRIPKAIFQWSACRGRIRGFLMDQS